MKQYQTDHLKEIALEVCKLGWNIKVYLLNDTLILASPYEVLAHIKNNKITIFSCAYCSDYSRRKITLFIQKYIKEIQK